MFLHAGFMRETDQLETGWCMGALPEGKEISMS